MLLLSATLLLFATPVLAQGVGGASETLYQWYGSAADDQFGTSVSGAGDVNGDGFDDLIVGVPNADPGGLPRAGSVFIYSGADGSLLHQWNGVAAWDSFGLSVSSVGDVNGDGYDDVSVGTPHTDPGGLSTAGTVYVYSGLNGALLHQWTGEAAGDVFGWSVSGAGDVNADGFDDVIIGAYLADPGGNSKAGSAYVYSGADGFLLYQWNGVALDERSGHSVSGAGDVNGDGFADVIVSAHRADPGGVSEAGLAFLYSGADGSILRQWAGEALGDRFSFSVSGAGDVNRDGVPDLIMGAPYADPGGGTWDRGSAYVYSGADGSLIHKWDGESLGDQFGESVSGAGDVNGDGYADLIVGALESGYGKGSAYVYSGADGSLLHRWDGSANSDFFGESVSDAGDVNGDGIDDVIISAFAEDSGGIFDAGAVYVFSFHSFLQANTPTISASTGGVLNFNLDFLDAAGFNEYITLMSIHGIGPLNYGIDIPLTLDSYLLDSAAGVYPFSISSDLHGTLDASGGATASITFPAGAFNFAIGHTAWFAAVAFPSGQLPVFCSVAVSVEVTP